MSMSNLLVGIVLFFIINKGTILPYYRYNNNNIKIHSHLHHKFRHFCASDRIKKIHFQRTILIKKMSRLLHIYIVIIIAALPNRLFAFSNRFQKVEGYSRLIRKYDSVSLRSDTTKLNLLTEEQQLEFWIATFSTAHIGMSAMRDKLIYACGESANRINLINRGFQLPSYWPSDEAGNEIFPDVDTAGRQIYRLLYTVVSFISLGSAFGSYLSSSETRTMILTEQDHVIFFGIASLSFAASIASLFNASPMSLMPAFQKEVQNNYEGKSESIAGIQRNDSLKMEPRGLTRITRHPLILPVVPWGVATSYLAGGRMVDFVLFGGIALYAIVGCACQDLRIIRKEGSVGTVFRPSSSDDGTMLDNFYLETSFVPFAAVFDGRQSYAKLSKEIPSIPFIVGIPIGMLIQELLLRILIH